MALSIPDNYHLKNGDKLVLKSDNGNSLVLEVVGVGRCITYMHAHECNVILRDDRMTKIRVSFYAAYWQPGYEYIPYVTIASIIR